MNICRIEGGVSSVDMQRVTAMIERKQAAHEDFARRFALACDDNPNVPEMNFWSDGYARAA